MTPILKPQIAMLVMIKHFMTSSSWFVLLVLLGKFKIYTQENFG